MRNLSIDLHFKNTPSSSNDLWDKKYLRPLIIFAHVPMYVGAGGSVLRGVALVVTRTNTFFISNLFYFSYMQDEILFIFNQLHVQERLK